MLNFHYPNLLFNFLLRKNCVTQKNVYETFQVFQNDGYWKQTSLLNVYWSCHTHIRHEII